MEKNLQKHLSLLSAFAVKKLAEKDEQIKGLTTKVAEKDKEIRYLQSRVQTLEVQQLSRPVRAVTRGAVGWTVPTARKI